MNLMRLLAEKQEVNEEVALVTVIASDNTRDHPIGSMMVVDDKGEVLGGSVGGGPLEENARKEAVTCLSRGLSRKSLLGGGDRSIEVFINVFCVHDNLIIAGAGNVALNIYRLAIILGYAVTIIDNRAEMLTRERFPEASELIWGDIPEKLAAYDITEDTYIVIATHHHEFDEPALQAVISSKAKYIGMLGNKRRVAACFDHLRSSNIAEDLIGRVHSPIGLDLGGRRTSEIALSILAEMQAVKYGRTGGFLNNNERKSESE